MAGVVVIAGIAVAVLATSGGGSNPSVAYRQSLATALGPLVTANSNLAGNLESISGTNDTSQKVAESQAASALTTAQNTVSALAAPPAAATLSQQAQQALDDENGYLQAVSQLLGTPSQNEAAQIQPLATSTTSAMVPLNAVVVGASSSVTGVQQLVSWAQGQAAVAQRARTRAQQQQVQHAISQAQATSRSATAAAAAPNGPSFEASGTDCGDGVVAGPDTSCAFAQNVQQAWGQAPGTTNTVDVYSPVTNQSYVMDCAPAGTGITCTGGNNASVSFPG